jgi:hypothetical protein
MPEGIKVPREILPGPVVDDETGVEALRSALNRYVAMTEPPVAHPFFGTMTRAEWDELHRIHCAHHLSVLIPKSSA